MSLTRGGSKVCGGTCRTVEIEMSESSTTGHCDVVEYRVGGKAHYDVASYDRIRYVGPQNEYRQTVMANAYMWLIRPLAGKRILDVGCGTGRGVVEFARESHLAIGCDASLDMLGFAARKAKDIPSCGLIASNAGHLPFQDAAFDVVASLNFLHLFNIDTQRFLVAEMKRVLKPGGTLVLEFTNALNGAAVGLFRRWVGSQPGVLSFPHEIRSVIGENCRVVRVYGAPLPTVWRFFYRFPKLFQNVEKLGYISPFKWFCQRLYYLVKKDHEPL
jgi:ubiquinone/menaquinone biosynthesis C-methylase UbiE